MNIHLNEDYNNKYKKLKKIGAGIFTDVYEAKIIDKNEKRAIKTIKLEDMRLNLDNECEDVDQEINERINKLKNEIENMIICGNNNENSVKYYESYQNEKEFAIIMELCHINLSKFLKIKKKFELDELYEILSQLNNTFKVMKENSIVHRDLKTNNILVTFDNENWNFYLKNFKKYKDKLKFKIKLCDYGLSKIGKLNSLTTLKIGTHFYIAPEIIDAKKNKEGHKYDYKCDLWSLGIIIYELCFQEKPYEEEREIEYINNIKNSGKNNFQKTKIEPLDDLISKLLEADPKLRLSWDEYFNHPFFKDYNYITVIYKTGIDGDVKIFDKKFVDNNKNNCRILYKNNFYELTENFETLEDILEIKLIGYINNMSYMFYGCISLKSLPDISLWNTSKVINMSNMFNGCGNLSSLPDLSKWNTTNVTDISYIFCECNLLKSLPDISLWDTSKVINMNYMFYDCKSLVSLPDLSNWNIYNVSDMSYMFYGCNFLLSLPDISKWNSDKVINMKCIFDFCNSLKYLPNLSKLKIINYDNTSFKKNMTIIIRSLSKSYNLEVKPSYSIGKIKWMIHYEEFFPYDQIELLYAGKILQNERPLDDYFIKDGYTIHCVLKIRGHNYIPIYIRYKDETKEIKICLCYKINDIKDVIFRQLFIKPEYQKISFNGNLLDDKAINLSSLGIKEGSILDLDLKNVINDNDAFDYKEKYKTQIYELEKMGFKENEINLYRLNECSGNIQLYFQSEE